MEPESDFLNSFNSFLAFSFRGDNRTRILVNFEGEKESSQDPLVEILSLEELAPSAWLLRIPSTARTNARNVHDGEKRGGGGGGVEGRKGGREEGFEWQANSTKRGQWAFPLIKCKLCGERD